MATLQELAIDFMHFNDHNVFGDFTLTIFGNPVTPESIWYSDREDKIYIHCGCPEFEGDLDIDSLSNENQAVLKKFFEAHI